MYGLKSRQLSTSLNFGFSKFLIFPCSGLDCKIDVIMPPHRSGRHSSASHQARYDQPDSYNQNPNVSGSQSVHHSRANSRQHHRHHHKHHHHHHHRKDQEGISFITDPGQVVSRPKSRIDVEHHESLRIFNEQDLVAIGASDQDKPFCKRVHHQVGRVIKSVLPTFEFRNCFHLCIRDGNTEQIPLKPENGQNYL